MSREKTQENGVFFEEDFSGTVRWKSFSESFGKIYESPDVAYESTSQSSLKNNQVEPVLHFLRSTREIKTRLQNLGLQNELRDVQ